jgi:predicted ATPase
MITSVRVRNFRSIAAAEVPLGPVTVLVGRNGAGKSSFVDTLQFIRDALTIGLENAVTTRKGISAVSRWAPRRPYHIEIAVTVEERGFWGEYALTISSSKDGSYRVKREACKVGRTPESISDSYEIRDGKWFTMPERIALRDTAARESVDQSKLALVSVSFFSALLTRMRRSLEGRFYHIFPNVLREPQKPSNEKVLLDHGENLATALRQLQREGRWYSDLVEALSRVVEGVADIRVREVGGFLVTELKHGSEETAPWFELAQESDGTLRLLGILVAVYQVNRGRGKGILAIEEPENSLHPGALAVLSDVILEVSRRRQVLVTTQSPDLISRFHATQLRVVERKQGITQIGLINEAQRQTIEEELFSAGDLLRIEGLQMEPQVTGANSA